MFTADLCALCVPKNKCSKHTFLGAVAVMPERNKGKFAAIRNVEFIMSFFQTRGIKIINILI